MPARKILSIVGLVIVGLIGLYFIVSSGRIQFDPFTLAVTAAVAVFMIYLSVLYIRGRQ